MTPSRKSKFNRYDQIYANDQHSVILKNRSLKKWIKGTPNLFVKIIKLI